MRKLLIYSFGLALPLLTILNGCDKKSTPAPPPPPKLIQLQSSATLGDYLTDKDGRTLYFFSNDYNGVNNCAGNCELAWPYYNVDNLTTDQLAPGLKFSDFKSITAANGKKQLSYKGWPLYYYAPSANGVNAPEAAGATLGEGVGGVWFVAKPNYTIMISNGQLVGSDGKSYKSDMTEGTGKTAYFVDSLGRTLYAFKNDRMNKNNYTKPDFSNNGTWPIYETNKIVIPSTLDKSLFGSIDVFGKKQLTYKGWPLYTFGQDGDVRGSNKGITFPAIGVWPVVTKNTATATP